MCTQPAPSACVMTRAFLLLQAHLYLVEAVGSLVLLGLGRFAFLPEHYTEMLVSCNSNNAYVSLTERERQPINVHCASYLCE